MHKTKKGVPFLELAENPKSATETDAHRRPQRKKDLRRIGDMIVATRRDDESPVISIAAVTQPICDWDNPTIQTIII